MKLKTKILTIAAFLGFNFMFSQVGVNTENPQGAFHIDGMADNELLGTPTLTQQENDIIINEEGGEVRVGLGTVLPTAGLDVRGKIKYEDSTPNKDELALTTDANGVASWQKLKARGIISATGGLGGTAVTNTTPKYMGFSITLPTGTWQINLHGTYEGPSGSAPATNIFWDLSTSSTTDTNVQRSISNGVTGSPATNKTVYYTTSAVFLVTHTEETTYYLWASLMANATLTYTGEGRMWAIPY